MIEITKEKIFEHFEIFSRDCMKQEKLMQQSAFLHFSSVVYRKILLLLGKFSSSRAENFPTLDSENFPSLDLENFPSLDLENFPTLDPENFPTLELENFPAFI